MTNRFWSQFSVCLFFHSLHFLMKFCTTTSNSVRALTAKRDGKAFYLIRKKGIRNLKYINSFQNSKPMIKWKWKSQKNSWAQNRRRKKSPKTKHEEHIEFLTSIWSSSLIWLKGTRFYGFVIYNSFFCLFFLLMLTCVHSSFIGNRQEELISLHPMRKALFFVNVFLLLILIFSRRKIYRMFNVELGTRNQCGVCYTL